MKEKSISFECPQCRAFQTLVLSDEKNFIQFNCGQCQKEIKFDNLNHNLMEACVVCHNKQLYQHKDFNKTLGLIIFLIGAVLAPWTYYISLFVALILDALLYPLFPWMNVCYQCKAEFRGWGKNPNWDRFNHEKAAHFEYSKK